MVIVPNVSSEVPPLKNNPVFLYSEDEFQKPDPFEPDIAVIIDQVFDQKIYACQPMNRSFLIGFHGLQVIWIKCRKMRKADWNSWSNGAHLLLMKPA